MKTNLKIFLAALITLPALAMQGDGKTRLHIEAGTKGHAPQVLQILKNQGSRDAHARDNYGNTPLHEACYFGCPVSVQHLLAYGADIFAENYDGETPFDKADATGQENILAILLEYSEEAIQDEPVRKPKKQQTRTQPQNQRPAQTQNGAQAKCIFDHLLYLPGLTGGAINLPIPVYHVYSEARVAENQEWCCSFHTLNNAVKLQRRICNSNISLERFKQVCRARSSKQDLHNGSEGDLSLEIADEIGIPHFHNLTLEGGRSQLTEDNENAIWRRLRTTFAQSRGPICMHFDCDIRSQSIEDPGHSEEHSILVSAIKMNNGACAIYILDNANEDEARKSQDQIRKHVMNVYQKLIG